MKPKPLEGNLQRKREREIDEAVKGECFQNWISKVLWVPLVTELDLEADTGVALDGDDGAAVRIDKCICGLGSPLLMTKLDAKRYPKVAPEQGNFAVEQQLEQLHTSEAYKIIQNHLALILGNWLGDSTSVAQISKYRVGQVMLHQSMYSLYKIFTRVHSFRGHENMLICLEALNCSTIEIGVVISMCPIFSVIVDVYSKCHELKA
ncbi:hypothetical protein F0562_012095 [Nyssa sinensis]|uniref:Uncharacterized protein n=1 Tax=Nyssa sinensis TaxID=561372 RepID=A0A5J4ZRF6_9ASTE|nr:hypothetical protein F0562_012095 [Nyssa sinensis]